MEKEKHFIHILNQNGIICKNDIFFFLHWGEGLLLRHFPTLIKRRVQDGGVLVYCILRELYISGSLKDSRDMASTMSSMKVLKLNRTYFMFFFIYMDFIVFQNVRVSYLYINTIYRHGINISLIPTLTYKNSEACAVYSTEYLCKNNLFEVHLQSFVEHWFTQTLFL